MLMEFVIGEFTEIHQDTQNFGYSLAVIHVDLHACIHACWTELIKYLTEPVDKSETHFMPNIHTIIGIIK
jgi:hypothetical protein